MGCCTHIDLSIYLKIVETLWKPLSIEKKEQEAPDTMNLECISDINLS